MEIIGIKETCLYISDLKSALSFYGKKMNFPVHSYSEGKHAFFKVGNDMLLCFNPVVSQSKKSPPAHFAKGKPHIAFEVSPHNYDKTKTTIQNLGIPIVDNVIWKNGQESFYFEDPFGNVLEIVPIGIWDD